MGCDIHPHIEVKINGFWQHHSCPHFKRDYRLFAKLANVRNDGSIKPIALPRGLPKDISEVTTIEAKFWGRDGHSHSWINAEEIREAYLFHVKPSDDVLDGMTAEQQREYHWELLRTGMEWGYLCGMGFEAFCKHDVHSSCFPPQYEDLRMVFWFDN